MLSTLAVFSGLLSHALAQDSNPPVINTPASVVQCLPSLLTFHGGVPPYTISAIPAGQVGAAPLVELGSQSGDSMTWIANLPSGTGITLQIRDSRGNINYSQAVTIQTGGDSSCLKSGSGPSPTTPPSSGSPPNPPAPVSTGTVSAPSSPKPGNSSATTPGSNPNATAPRPNPTTPTTGPSNTTKGPSPFVPPTSNTSITTPINGTTSPVDNAAAAGAASAASSTSVVSQQAFIVGLAVAAPLMALFA